MLANIKRILEGCGASVADVVKCSVFLKDGTEFAVSDVTVNSRLGRQVATYAAAVREAGETRGKPIGV